MEVDLPCRDAHLMTVNDVMEAVRDQRAELSESEIWSVNLRSRMNVKETMISHGAAVVCPVHSSLGRAVARVSMTVETQR